MAVVTLQPIQLRYFIQDIASALALFNRIRWYRSRTGQNGLYEAATGPAAGPAALVGTAVTPFGLNGKTLSFKVNGVTTVNVLFTDPDPVTLAQVITAITGATALVVATNDGNGRLVLTTAAAGSGASIEILESDAAPYLGFGTGDAAVGTDADTVLVSGTHEYNYLDQNSSFDFWYRVELLHSVTLETNGLSVPFSANQFRGLNKNLTITGYVRLTDMGGEPISERTITFANPFLPNTVVDGSTRWGVFRHFKQVLTDKDGYAEVRLIRGMTVDVTIEGSGFVRRIQIPATGDSVDILDPTLVVQDEFGIQQPNVNFAIRTT